MIEENSRQRLNRPTAPPHTAPRAAVPVREPRLDMRYAHTFQTYDRFATAFKTRMTPDGAVLPANAQPAPGSPVELDLRLPDGTQLLVGTARVEGPSDSPPGVAIRFESLSAQSRVTVARLTRSTGAGVEAPLAEPAPGGDTPADLASLVDSAYGNRGRPDLSPTKVFVPPPGSDPASPEATHWRETPGDRAPAAAPRAGSGAASAPAPPQRRLRWETLAAVVVALLAGGALHAYFDQLAVLMGFDADPVFALEPTVDLMPDEVRPSDFSAEDPGDTDAELDASTEAPTGVVALEPLPPDEPAADGSEGAPSRPTTPDPLTPLDRIRMITWDEEDGRTVVTLWANGGFLDERVVHSRIGGERPREVVKLRGVDLPYRELVIPAGTGTLERIRTGFHPRQPVNELHVVLDLSGPGARLEKMETDGSALRLVLSKQEDSEVPADGLAGQ